MTDDIEAVRWRLEADLDGYEDVCVLLADHAKQTAEVERLREASRLDDLLRQFLTENGFSVRNDDTAEKLFGSLQRMFAENVDGG